MNNIDLTAASTKTVRFPRLLLSGAIEVVERASKFGKQWTKEAFASFSTKEGKGSSVSGAFKERIASLKDYGLITISTGFISKTELVDKIVMPLSANEKEEGLKEAFMNVGAFSAVLGNLSRDQKLSRSAISEYAVRQIGISRSSVNDFVTSFIESGKFCGLIAEVDNDTIVIPSASSKDSAALNVESVTKDSSPSSLDALSRSSFSAPLPSGIVLVFPPGLSEAFILGEFSSEIKSIEDKAKLIIASKEKKDDRDA